MTLTTRVQFSRPRRRVWLPGGGGAAASSATWSTTDKNGNVTMSDVNLTATSAAGFSAGRGDTATTLIGAGAKRFWGTRINTAGDINRAGVGFCTASQTFGDGAFLGIQTHGYGYYNGTGEVYFNNSNVFDRANFAAGDIVWQEYDRVLGLWRTAVNDGAWSSDLDVSAFGDVYPAFCVRTGGSVTLIPGPTFTRTPTTGFSGFA